LKSQIKLSELIEVWEILHVKDTGDIGFCDVDKALQDVGVTIVNDCSSEQPKELDQHSAR